MMGEEIKCPRCKGKGLDWLTPADKGQSPGLAAVIHHMLWAGEDDKPPFDYEAATGWGKCPVCNGWGYVIATDEPPGFRTPNGQGA